MLTCRTKQCRRKSGSITALRAVKKHPGNTQRSPSPPIAPQTQDLGSHLFGTKKTADSPSLNPFSQSHSNDPKTNPFSSHPLPSTLAAKAPQETVEEALSTDFSSELRISDDKASKNVEASVQDSWPPQSSFPKSFEHVFLESDYEYLVLESKEVPKDTSSKIQYEDESSTGTKDLDKEIFESTMDKTFMRFSDRLAQNPEQVIRYDYKGNPLLYSDKDEVGKMLSESSTRPKGGTGMPNCEKCGSGRVFEVQLVPGAIEAVEGSDIGLEDGMDWGTIIVGSCARNCGDLGQTTFRREWCGVQWE